MTYHWTDNIDTPIDEDGVLGPQTISALQYGLDVPVNGNLDSTTVKKLQWVLFNDVPKPAGVIGPVTTKALEAKLAVTVTGQTPWNHNTVLALQYCLNQGRWGLGLPPVTTPPPSGGGTTTPPPPVNTSGWVASSAINDKTGVSFARYTAGGTVAQWIAAACTARGITDPTAINYWVKGYTTAISRESSGDANACNTNDSNDVTPPGYSQVADYGTGYGNPSGNLNGRLVNYQCSRGVAQCIPQTFAANHCPGTSSMIYDPVANIAASMGYVRAQYGVSADGHDLASKVQQFDPSRPPKGY